VGTKQNYVTDSSSFKIIHRPMSITQTWCNTIIVSSLYLLMQVMSLFLIVSTFSQDDLTKVPEAFLADVKRISEGIRDWASRYLSGSDTCRISAFCSREGADRDVSEVGRRPQSSRYLVPLFFWPQQSPLCPLAPPVRLLTAACGSTKVPSVVLRHR